MKTTKIKDRLDIYGMPVCPIDGNPLEHVFAKVDKHLVCRNHPGHPLYRTAKHARA